MIPVSAPCGVSLCGRMPRTPWRGLSRSASMPWRACQGCATRRRTGRWRSRGAMCVAYSGASPPVPPLTRLAWAHGIAYTLHGRHVSRGIPAVARRRYAHPHRSLQHRRPPMAETPTFGRYAEIPYEQMTPEQQEGYRSTDRDARAAARPEQDLCAQPQAGEGDGAARRAFPHRLLAQRARARDRRLRHHQQVSFGLSDQRARAGRQGGRAAGRQGRGDPRGPADLIHRHTRAGRLRDGDVPRQCALGVEGPLSTARSKPSAMSASPT